MNGRMIGVIGGTGRVGRECLRYLHENTAFGLLIGGRKPPREALPGSFLSVDVFDEASLARFCGQCSLVINCAGPASAVRERVAAAALAGGADLDALVTREMAAKRAEKEAKAKEGARG